MSSLNHIEGENIANLKAHELVRLLRCLLYSEAKGLQASVHVPLEIEVPDGGEDGRWKGPVGPKEYIPNTFTIYQCKAQRLSPTDCMAEMIKGGRRAAKQVAGKIKSSPRQAHPELRDQVAEVLEARGCFVFFCASPYVTKDMKACIAGSRKAIKATGRSSRHRDQLVFLDANQIAAWVNEHASAVAYVCECLRLIRAVSFRTWSDWERDPSVRTPAFRSNGKLDQYMAQLQQQLIKPQSVARITGLSGLGKTRLAFEALRPPKDALPLQQAVLSDTTVYIDLAENPVDAVFSVVRQLACARHSGTIVVDNCPRNPPYHDKLADIVSMDGSRLSLLTLDYEPETIATDFLLIPLQAEVMADVIPAMLKDLPQAKLLTEIQINHIAAFARGFPQIAVLMMAAGDTLDLRRLNERGLADRILWGRDAPSAESKQIIRALALFTHVGFDGQVEAQKEFVRVRLCQDISDHKFRELCGPFRRRRILQPAGDYLMVTPPPLAVALAADWWEHATDKQLMDLFPEMEKCGLRSFFCRQVERLHFSPNAQAIAAKLCGDQAPLSNAEVLSSVAGSQLFRAMVELNPLAAVDCLDRVFSPMTLDKLLQVTDGRRNLIWSLEKLCWDRQCFVRAATLLLSFAAAENETWANNATGQFKHLYLLYLSGTQTPALERLWVIEAGLATGQPARRRICVEALGAALQAGHFSRSGGVEVRGSGLPQLDWQPQSFRETADYWITVVRLLTKLILEKSPESPVAKHILGDSLRGILIPPLLQDLEPSLKAVADAESRFWPEALHSINEIFEYDQDHHTPESLARLREWLLWLAPQDIEHRLDLAVTQAPYEHRKASDGEYVDAAAMRAERFAEELVEGHVAWENLLPKLCQGEQRQAWVFGRRLGQLHPQPQAFISQCLTTLRTVASGKRNSNLLAGFLAGLAQRELATQTLDAVASDDQLKDLLPYLTANSRPQKADIERVAKLVADGRIEGSQLRLFGFGQIMRSFSSTEVIGILDSVVQKQPSLRGAVYDVISMYVFQSDTRWEECKDYVKQLLSSPDFLKALDLHHDAYHWEKHALLFIDADDSDAFAINQTKQIVEIQTDDNRWLAADRHTSKVLGKVLAKHPSTCWPIVGRAMLSDRFYMLSTLFKDHGFRDEPTSVLWSVPPHVLVKWAAKHRSAIWRILEITSLFTVAEDGSYAWHPVILKLLEQKFDKRWTSAISCNLSSFGSVGSRAPYVERRVALLRQLSDHVNLGVRNMAHNLIGGFEAETRHQQKRDQEHAAGV